jgi:DNA-binding HxlR family transcriptional regulator
MNATQTRICSRYHQAVELIGRRWSGAILRELLAGFSHFTEIKAAIPDLSARMLSERLNEFEDEGIVERVVLSEKPVRVEYRLTAKGLALGPAVEALSQWAEEWLSKAGTADEERENAESERARD